MMVVVMMVISTYRAQHPDATIPDIAVLEIPAAAVVMMVMMVVVINRPWFILGVEKPSGRILAARIVGIEAAHGIRDRLQQIRVGRSRGNWIG